MWMIIISKFVEFLWGLSELKSWMSYEHWQIVFIQEILVIIHEEIVIALIDYT
jgi:hypothetical protein